MVKPERMKALKEGLDEWRRVAGEMGGDEEVNQFLHGITALAQHCYDLSLEVDSLRRRVDQLEANKAGDGP